MCLCTLHLIGCGEEPAVRSYTATAPAAYDWPKTEARLTTHEAGRMNWVWEVPPGWVDAPEVPDMLVADYRFPGATEALPGRMTVAMIPGDAGGVEPNVMRWLQQLYLTNVARLGPKDMMYEPVPGTTFVELHGQYQGPNQPSHLFGVIKQLPAQEGGVFQTWTFKLVGDPATVEQNRLALIRLVLSFRPEGAEAPDLPDELFDGSLPLPPTEPDTDTEPDIAAEDEQDAAGTGTDTDTESKPEPEPTPGSQDGASEAETPTTP